MLPFPKATQMPRSAREPGQGNRPIQETIPRPPVRSFPYTLTCQPMAAGRDGDTARAAEGHPISLGRAGAGPPHLGRGPAPVPLILPSAPRQFGQSGGPQAGWEPLEDLAGRGGRTRGPRLEAVPPLRREIKDQRLVRPDGALAKDSHVDHVPDRPQRMVRGHPLLGADAAEHPCRLSIVAAYAPLLVALESGMRARSLRRISACC
jgi:hypothetical protein